MTSSTPFVEFAAGDAILREGEAASALYIIESGKVAILRGETPLVELGPGDFFGEMAILQESAHSASARAATAVRALRIDAASFHGVLRENVEIAVQLMRRLVLRLKAVEQRAADTIASGGDKPVARPPGSAATSAASAPAVATPASEPGAVGPAPLAAPVAVAPAVVPGAAAIVATPAAEPATALLLRHAGGEIAVPAGKSELMIGRPDPATGTIPEINLGPVDTARTLSRRHARLILANGRWMLREEPGVGNGTWVNGERLQPEQTVSVKAGDALRFGAIEVELLRD
jgi:hypothetical protein